MEKIVFDIESTGVDVNNDRIVQIGLAIYDKDWHLVSQKSILVNPTVKIPKEATQVHGITDEMVKDAPTFRDIARRLAATFGSRTIVGYNILGFDLPILMAEFERARVVPNFSDKIIDVYKIESNLFPRNLSAIYKKYTSEELEDAHDALSDTKATVEILQYQIQLAEGLGKNLYELSGSDKLLDYGGKFAYDEEGFVIFNFGKHKGSRLIEQEDYCKWMLGADFPNQVKDIIKKEIHEH